MIFSAFARANRSPFGNQYQIGSRNVARQNHIFRKIRAGSQAEKLAKQLMERGAGTSVKRISTIGALVSAGMGLRVNCVDCGAPEELGGDVLLERYGAECPLADVRPSCTACGSAKVETVPN